MKNKTGIIKVATKSDRPKQIKKKSVNKIIPMTYAKGKVKMGTRMNGKRQAVPNLMAMRKRELITSMD